VIDLAHVVPCLTFVYYSGAGLENRHTGNGIESSNLSLSVQHPIDRSESGAEADPPICSWFVERATFAPRHQEDIGVIRKIGVIGASPTF